MEHGILTSTKKILGVAEDYTVFDTDIITYINMAFSTLNQLNLSDLTGFAISGYFETWTEYTEDEPKLNAIKNYVFLKTKLLFDPPVTSFAIESMQTQINELEWRLTTYASD